MLERATSSLDNGISYEPDYRAVTRAHCVML